MPQTIVLYLQFHLEQNCDLPSSMSSKNSVLSYLKKTQNIHSFVKKSKQTGGSRGYTRKSLWAPNSCDNLSSIVQALIRSHKVIESETKGWKNICYGNNNTPSIPHQVTCYE